MLEGQVGRRRDGTDNPAVLALFGSASTRLDDARTDGAWRDSASQGFSRRRDFVSRTDESETFRPYGRSGARTPAVSKRRAEGQNWRPRIPERVTTRVKKTRAIQRRMTCTKFNLIACSCCLARRPGFASSAAEISLAS